jgi:hypothetical protein
VVEPEFPRGATFASALRAAGVTLSDEPDGALPVRVVASRVPLPIAELERLRFDATEGPVIIVSLQNDEVLGEVRDAAVRVSGADSTELTRGVVARMVADALRSPA